MIKYILIAAFLFNTASAQMKHTGDITVYDSMAIKPMLAPGYIIFNPLKEFDQHYRHDSLSSFQAYIRFQLAWQPHGGDLVGNVLAAIPDTVFKIIWGKKTWDSLYNQ